MSEQPKKIIGVALRRYDLIVYQPRPARHHHLIRGLSRSGVDFVTDWEQGFLSDAGTFLTRREAAELALASGAVEAPHSPDELFSEDLW